MQVFSIGGAMRSIALSLSLLGASACSGTPPSPVYKPSCNDMPWLVSDCMAVMQCGVESSDNYLYTPCRMSCEKRVEKQCRIERIKPVAPMKRLR